MRETRTKTIDATLKTTELRMVEFFSMIEFVGGLKEFSRFDNSKEALLEVEKLRLVLRNRAVAQKRASYSCLFDERFPPHNWAFCGTVIFAFDMHFVTIRHKFSVPGDGGIAGKGLDYGDCLIAVGQ